MTRFWQYSFRLSRAFDYKSMTRIVGNTELREMRLLSVKIVIFTSLSKHASWILKFNKNCTNNKLFLVRVPCGHKEVRCKVRGCMHSILILELSKFYMIMVETGWLNIINIELNGYCAYPERVHMIVCELVFIFVTHSLNALDIVLD